MSKWISGPQSEQAHRKSRQSVKGNSMPAKDEAEKLDEWMDYLEKDQKEDACEHPVLTYSRLCDLSLN